MSVNADAVENRRNTQHAVAPLHVELRDPVLCISKTKKGKRKRKRKKGENSIPARKQEDRWSVW
jgi:hypothetical protein